MSNPDTSFRDFEHQGWSGQDRAVVEFTLALGSRLKALLPAALTPGVNYAPA